MICPQLDGQLTWGSQLRPLPYGLRGNLVTVALRTQVISQIWFSLSAVPQTGEERQKTLFGLMLLPSKKCIIMGPVSQGHCEGQ